MIGARQLEMLGNPRDFLRAAASAAGVVVAGCATTESAQLSDDIVKRAGVGASQSA